MAAGARGFTIVEIMITLIVLGILITYGAPEFIAFLQNQKTRAAADAVLSGLQTARAEAVQRNLAVQFKLTAVPTSSWTVSESASGTVIQTRSAEEGTATVTVTAVDLLANPVTTVTFSPIGGVAANADASAALRKIDLANPQATAGNARNYRVLISGGGSLRMCDPNVTVANDPRYCPASY
jgi:type IV fimbrial biogenesis protein FimT